MEAPSSPDPQRLGLVWRTHRLPSCVGICRQALQHSRSPDQCGGRGGVADADDVRVDRGVLPLQSLPFPSGRAGALLPTNNAHMLPCSCVNIAHCTLLIRKELFTYYVSQNHGFLDPPPPPSAMVSIWLTPPPPLVSFCQHLPDAPFVLQFFT